MKKIIFPVLLSVTQFDTHQDVDWLQCVVCKNCNLHFKKPFYNEGNEGKDAEIVIAMNCEMGHSWNFVFDYHKGATVLRLCDVYEKTLTKLL